MSNWIKLNDVPDHTHGQARPDWDVPTCLANVPSIVCDDGSVTTFEGIDADGLAVYRNEKGFF